MQFLTIIAIFAISQLASAAPTAADEKRRTELLPGFDKACVAKCRGYKYPDVSLLFQGRGPDLKRHANTLGSPLIPKVVLAGVASASTILSLRLVLRFEELSLQAVDDSEIQGVDSFSLWTVGCSRIANMGKWLQKTCVLLQLSQGLEDQPIPVG